MRPTHLGIAIGVALGFAAVIGGFQAFFIVGVAIFVGFVIGKVVEGELDVTTYLGRNRTRR